MRLAASLLLFALVALPVSVWSAPDQVHLSKGQTVYVPVYSNVFSGPRNLPYQLAATLSIRNTDMDSWLRITAIDYYDTSGKLLRRYQDKPLSLAPLASTYVHIEEKDVAGGFGANFIVKWQADRTMNAPIIETVMIGATSGQGISFVSPGQVIRPGTR
ncbi:DUF3124 domain-containing protein [Geomonas paludis]|uniref:DUF3124 domain-containing protein n=1 Tax=Geomonas paludis TaxID=2740185 RepID=A0A6V8MVM0_9BACT|nr:DUF3124 domain-containing protein [Geomonas paludis]UPU38111.1 DUF3124 domain-containing protein [Geomonas paludis]GFO63359.1 hypothetical protein GMPD_12780 [Geomonas paludis]